MDHLFWSCVEYESARPALLDAVERLGKWTDIPIRELLAASNWYFLKAIFDFCRTNGLTVWLSFSKMSAILYPIIFPLVCLCASLHMLYIACMFVLDECMNVRMNECNVYGWVIGIDGRQKIIAWTMFLRWFTRELERYRYPPSHSDHWWKGLHGTNAREQSDTDDRNVIWTTKLDYTQTTSDGWIQRHAWNRNNTDPEMPFGTLSWKSDLNLAIRLM